MNSRRAFTAAVLLQAGPLALARAVTPTLRQVGLLSIGATQWQYKPLTQALRAFGWTEGENVAYLARSGEGDVTRLDALAMQLVAERAEVIVVADPLTTRAAQRATKTIPIVMANVSNAVENGFVQSLARPGGNITGVTSQLVDILGKLIQIFHEVVPEARRVALLLNDLNPSHGSLWEAAQRAGASLGLTMVRVTARSAAEFPSATQQIARERLQGVVVVADQMYAHQLPALVEALARTRLPVACASRFLLPAGILSYASDWQDNHRRAALFVDRILRGSSPADLPVEQPTKFELAINTKAAQALRIQVPESVLVRATEIL